MYQVKTIIGEKFNLEIKRPKMSIWFVSNSILASDSTSLKFFSKCEFCLNAPQYGPSSVQDY